MFVRGAAIGSRMGRQKLNRGPLPSLLAGRPIVAQTRMAPIDQKCRRAPSRRTLVAACQATAVGVGIVALGAVMCGFGFYADSLSAEAFRSHNNTVTSSRIVSSRRVGLLSLSYVGPVVMAIGAFLLIFACVMTLEERDRREIEAVKIAAVAKAKTDLNPNVTKPTDKSQPSLKKFEVTGQLNRCFVRDDSRASASSRVDLPPPRRISSASCLPDAFGRPADSNVPLRRLLADLKSSARPATAVVKAEVHRGVAPVAVWDSTVSLAETSEDDADRLLQRSFLESSGTDGTATLLSRYSGTAAAKSGSFSTVRSPAGVPDWLVVARSLQDVNGNPTRRPLTSATGNFASVLAITPVRLDNRPHLLPY